MSGGGAERERERERQNPKQAPGSELTAQSQDLIFNVTKVTLGRLDSCM